MCTQGRNICNILHHISSTYLCKQHQPITKKWHAHTQSSSNKKDAQQKESRNIPKLWCWQLQCITICKLHKTAQMLTQVIGKRRQLQNHPNTWPYFVTKGCAPYYFISEILEKVWNTNGMHIDPEDKQMAWNCHITQAQRT